MSEQTKIQWTDHTGGPWLVCTEVSPGCARCYARELILSRLRHLIRKAFKAAGFADWETRPVWGKTAPRVLSKGFWEDVRRWNRQAICSGCGKSYRSDRLGGLGHCSALGGCGAAIRRANVFPSLIDWLDDMPAGMIGQDGVKVDPIEVFARFLRVIFECQNLNFLLLTKRPQNWRARMYDALWCVEGLDPNEDTDEYVCKTELGKWIDAWIHDNPPKNVWIGFSAENSAQLRARWEHAKQIPAVVHFISAEPLLENVDKALSAVLKEARDLGVNLWTILGGESGSDARPCNVEWIRIGVLLCQANHVPCFVKQLGR